MDNYPKPWIKKGGKGFTSTSSRVQKAVPKAKKSALHEQMSSQKIKSYLKNRMPVQVSEEDCPLCQRRIKLKHLPKIIQKALFSKYSNSINFFYSKAINEILSSSRSTSLLQYNELKIWNGDKDYMVSNVKSNEYKEKFLNLWKYHQFNIDQPKQDYTGIFIHVELFYQARRKVQEKAIKRMLEVMTDSELENCEIHLSKFAIQGEEVLEASYKGPDRVIPPSMNFRKVRTPSLSMIESIGQKGLEDRGSQKSSYLILQYGNVDNNWDSEDYFGSEPIKHKGALSDQSWPSFIELAEQMKLDSLINIEDHKPNFAKQKPGLKIGTFFSKNGLEKGFNAEESLRKSKGNERKSKKNSVAKPTKQPKLEIQCSLRSLKQADICKTLENEPAGQERDLMRGDNSFQKEEKFMSSTGIRFERKLVADSKRSLGQPMNFPMNKIPSISQKQLNPAGAFQQQMFQSSRTKSKESLKSTGNLSKAKLPKELDLKVNSIMKIFNLDKQQAGGAPRTTSTSKSKSQNSRPRLANGTMRIKTLVSDALGSHKKREAKPSSSRTKEGSVEKSAGPQVGKITSQLMQNRRNAAMAATGKKSVFASASATSVLRSEITREKSTTSSQKQIAPANPSLGVLKLGGQVGLGRQTLAGSPRDSALPAGSTETKTFPFNVYSSKFIHNFIEKSCKKQPMTDSKQPSPRLQMAIPPNDSFLPSTVKKRPFQSDEKESNRLREKEGKTSRSKSKKRGNSPRSNSPKLEFRLKFQKPTREPI